MCCFLPSPVLCASTSGWRCEVVDSPTGISSYCLPWCLLLAAPSAFLSLICLSIYLHIYFLFIFALPEAVGKVLQCGWLSFLPPSLSSFLLSFFLLSFSLILLPWNLGVQFYNFVFCPQCWGPNPGSECSTTALTPLIIFFLFLHNILGLYCLSGSWKAVFRVWRGHGPLELLAILITQWSH